jgi:hypothetical protein
MLIFLNAIGHPGQNQEAWLDSRIEWRVEAKVIELTQEIRRQRD